MAVSEAARSNSKAGGQTHTQRTKTPQTKKGKLKLLALSCMLIVPPIAIAQPANAQIKADKNAKYWHRPHILKARNGVPIVNITTPNIHGTSRNQYSQFDIDKKGAILNNNGWWGTNTELAGKIKGNYRLGFGGAKTIVNEINSAKPMKFNGKLEVAGRPANVILASPAGINVNGGSFINANKATLAAAKINIPWHKNQFNYTTTDGKVTINPDRYGEGLSFKYNSDAKYADIYAQAVELNGKINAGSVQIITGQNDIYVDHNNQLLRLKEQKNTDNKAAKNPNIKGVALDVSHLGGIYAKSINIIGTQAGFGVKNAGELKSEHHVGLNANGTIENTGIIESSSKTPINSLVLIHTNKQSETGDFINKGTVKSDNMLVVETSGSIKGDGSIIRKGEQPKFHKDFDLLKLKSKGDMQIGKLISDNKQGNIAIEAAGKLTVSKQAKIDSKDDILLIGEDDLSLTNSKITNTGKEKLVTIYSGNDLDVNGLDINIKDKTTSTALTAKNNITLTNTKSNIKGDIDIIAGKNSKIKQANFTDIDNISIYGGESVSLDKTNIKTKNALNVNSENNLNINNSQLKQGNKSDLIIQAGDNLTVNNSLFKSNKSIILESVATDLVSDNDNNLTLRNSKIDAAKDADMIASGNVHLDNSKINADRLRATADNNIDMNLAKGNTNITNEVLLKANDRLTITGKNNNLTAKSIETLSANVKVGEDISLNTKEHIRITASEGDINLGSHFTANTETNNIEISANQGKITASEIQAKADVVSLLASDDVALKSKEKGNNLTAKKGINLGSINTGKLTADNLTATSQTGTINLIADKSIAIKGTDNKLTADKVDINSKKGSITAHNLTIDTKKEGILVKAAKDLTLEKSKLNANNNIQLHADKHNSLENVQATTKKHMAVSSGGTLGIASSQLTAQGVMSSTSKTAQSIKDTNMSGGAVLVKSLSEGVELGDNVNFNAQKTSLLANDKNLKSINGSLSLETENDLTIAAGRSLVSENDLSIETKGTVTLASIAGEQGTGSEKVVNVDTKGNLTIKAAEITIDGADITAKGQADLFAHSGDVHIGTVQNKFNNIVPTERIKTLKQTLSKIDNNINSLQTDTVYSNLVVKKQDITKKITALDKAQEKAKQDDTLKPDPNYKSKKEALIAEIAKTEILIKQRANDLGINATVEELKEDKAKNQTFLTNAKKPYSGIEHKGSNIQADDDINIYSTGGIRVEASDITSNKGSVTLNALGINKSQRVVIDEKTRAELIKLSKKVYSATDKDKTALLNQQQTLIDNLQLTLNPLNNNDDDSVIEHNSLEKKRKRLKELAKKSAKGDSDAYQQQLKLIAQLPPVKAINTGIIIEGLVDLYERGTRDDNYYSLHNYNHASSITAAKNITINATGDKDPTTITTTGAENNIIINSGDYTAKDGDITIRSVGDVYLQAAQDSIYDKETNVYKKKSWGGIKKKVTIVTSEKSNQIADVVDLNANNVNIQAGDNIYAYGTKINNPNGQTNLIAGDAIRLFSVEDIDYSKVDKKTKKSFFGISYKKKKESNTHQQANRLPSSISAEIIKTGSGDDTQLQGTEFNYLLGADIKAGVGAKARDDAKIVFEAITNSVYENQKADSNYIVWQKQTETGHNTETAQLPKFNGPVSPNFSAPGGLDIQVALTPEQASDKNNLVNVVNNMANQPGYGYLKELTKRNDIDFTAFKLTKEQWDYKQEGLTPAGAALVALAVTMATGGSGAAATTGLDAAMGAAWSSLQTQAAITLINNKGDIGKTLKDLSSQETIKSLATAALTAGAVHGVMNNLPASTQKYLNGLEKNSFEYRFINKSIENSVGAVVNVGVNGGDLSEQLQQALLTSVADAGQGFAATQIKELEANYVLHKIAHAAAGCAAASVKKQECEAGAIGAAVGEIVAQNLSKKYEVDINGDKVLILTDKQKQDILNISQLVAGTTAAYSGYDADTAISSAGTAVENNAVWLAIPAVLWVVDKAFTGYEIYQDIQRIKEGKITPEGLAKEKGTEYVAQAIAGHIGKYGIKIFKRGGKWYKKKISSSTCSFRGDMMVKTITGYRPIAEIQVGDIVLARNELTGTISYQKVLNQYNNPYKQTVYVNVKDKNGNTQTIVSNKIHPFFTKIIDNKGQPLPPSSEGHNYQGEIKNAQWVDASNLKAGYQLLSENGEWQVVQSVKQTNEPLSAYNLTVNNDHTYFVTGSASTYGVWVHNTCWGGEFQYRGFGYQKAIDHIWQGHSFTKRQAGKSYFKSKYSTKGKIKELVTTAKARATLISSSNGRKIYQATMNEYVGVNMKGKKTKIITIIVQDGRINNAFPGTL